MVKSEIIAKLSERIHRKLTKSDLEKILKIIINTIIKEAKNQKGTEIRKFGRFSQKVIKEKLTEMCFKKYLKIKSSEIYQ